MWMFGGYELLMRQFSRLHGTPWEVSNSLPVVLAQELIELRNTLFVYLFQRCKRASRRSSPGGSLPLDFGSWECQLTISRSK